MDRNLVIGIEGLVGTGKTSICKELSNYIPNSIIFHANNVYRAIAYKILEEKIDIRKLKNKDIKKFYEKFKINIKVENNETVVYAEKEKLEENKLQSQETSIAVSQISNIADNKNAYKLIHSIIEQFREKYNVIFSGRDTMKIFPELDYHFFIKATLEERVKRKCIQYKDNKIDLETIRNTIIKRDKLQENSGYYNIYDKTITIDVTDCMDVSESTRKVLNYIKLPQSI